MTFTRKLHATAALLMGLWLVPFLLIVAAGTCQLGGLPSYGNPADPYSLGLHWLGLPLMLLFVAACLAVPAWVAAGGYLLTYEKSAFAANWKYNGLALTSIVLFFVLRFGCAGLWGWVTD